jgi:hypothetical protein
MSLFPYDVNSLNSVRIQKRFSAIQSARGDADEERSSTVGKEGPDYQGDRPSNAFQRLLDLQGV